MTEKNTNRINKISIDKLFGYYTYEINPNQSEINDNHLIIIYGDNGTGKTKILELVFYLLSTLNNSGHKSKISEIKFKEISITLDNGTKISASRESATDGSYSVSILENGKIILTVQLVANKSYSIRIKEQSEEDQEIYEKIIEYIKNLDISIFYLSDNRKVLSVDPEDEGRHYRNYLSRRDKSANVRIYRNRDVLISDNDEHFDELDLSIKKLENWIRQQVIQGARKGDKNTNNIYLEIVNHITNPNKEVEGLQDRVDSLQNTLNEINNRSTPFYKYGLVSHVETAQLENSLIGTSTKDLQVLYSVIKPYADGLKARLDSLNDIQELISNFIESINSYLANKTLTYHLNEGFIITHDFTKEPLKFRMLSSGERQLLLLISHVITGSEKATIFIIDEPEISLNIKWQRKLVDTLLDFGKGKNVQFILASHSIELITGHKDQVSKLINLNPNYKIVFE